MKYLLISSCCASFGTRSRMKRRRRAVMLAIVMTAALTRGGSAAEESFEGWNLEPGVSRAHLVMVARVASVSRLTIVEGAKTDVALREYRFQPIRVLKGLFHRDQLSMTAADLGCPADEGTYAPPLKEGEFRLLILAQQPGRFLGCVSAAPGATSFGERVPLLTGADDPLVSVIETLIEVDDARSRRRRATLLIDRLEKVDGLAAVPLLSSLRLRADWAATDERILASLTRSARNRSIAVRGAALGVLQDVLASQITFRDPGGLERTAEALRDVLESDADESDETVTSVRLAALDSLGRLLAMKVNIAWAREWLIEQLTQSKTYAERAAASTALSRINHPQSVAALRTALEKAPLDENPSTESTYISALERLDAAATERILQSRLDRSIRAGLPLAAEIESIGRMRCQSCLPLLLIAAEQSNVQPLDRYRLAWALGRLGDDRAVPVLTRMLRENNYELKEIALAALENLDSQTSARDLRPLLRTEPDLTFKLRIAHMLARHDFNDGYDLATEHLADLSHTAEATLILATLNDKRTFKDLSALLAARPDRRLQAAALAGLAATGDATARRRIREILTDDRNPLAADAAEAAGLAGDPDLLLPLAALVQSRNKQIAMSSLVAVRRFLMGVRHSTRGPAGVDIEAPDAIPQKIELPEKTRDAIATAVATVAGDVYIDLDVRRQAFAVAKLLHGERLAKLAADLADQTELEGTSLSAEAQAEMRNQRGLTDRRSN